MATKNDDPNRPDDPKKAREYDRDMADVARQEREIEQRDGGAGIRTTDLPASDTKVTSETPAGGAQYPRAYRSFCRHSQEL